MLITGQMFGRYSVRSLIGSGGMGEVYLAEDTELERRVALKVLPARVIDDEKSIHRFIREAKAASALNHPNILTIYETGEIDGLRFIASEFVEGKTLNRVFDQKSFKPSEIIDIAIQIASALQAAHEAGVVHRDIKPENIMIREDRLVKVLDFGLAKLTEQKIDPIDSEAPTRAQVNTKAGLILGTAAYMSPEQARGKTVDARSDLWSFGVVLYELLTGKKPFTGETSSDVIAAILKSEPPPISLHVSEYPPEIEHLIYKTLRKVREERLQTASELLADLKAVRQQMEFEARTDQLNRLTTGEHRNGRVTKDFSARNSTDQAHPVATRSSISSLIYEAKAHPAVATLALSVIILLVFAAGFGVYRLMNSGGKTEAYQNMRLAKLTSRSRAVGGVVAISPDGRYAAYAEQDAGKESLWVKHIPTSGNVQILPPDEVHFGSVIFSPDSNYVFYTVSRPKSPNELYQMPVLGGNARKLLDNVGDKIDLSPGGDRIAFIRDEKFLMTANADGGGQRTVAISADGDRWDVPAWSPDGNIIMSTFFSASDDHVHIVEVGAETGAVKAFPASPWLSVSGIDWLSDGTALVISGRDLETKASQLWLISYPDGALRRITNDLSSYQGLNITADSSSIISVQQEWLSNIWSVPENGGGAAAPRRVTLDEGRDEGMSGVAWTPDGRIVYTTRISGTQDLWIVDEDGSNNRQLTFNARSNFSPAVSPDGRYIVFVSDRTGNPNLWRMNLEGGNPVQLTDDPGIEGEPVFTPDGKWIVYHLFDVKNKLTLWKMSVDGGAPVRLTEEEAGKPRVSPDGSSIACEYGRSGAGQTVKLAVFSLDDPRSPQIFDFPAVIRSRNYRWSADGKAIVYVDHRNEVSNLWRQPLNGGAPEQITNFDADKIFRFDLSPAGRGFALARGKESSNVVLVSSFR